MFLVISNQYISRRYLIISEGSGTVNLVNTSNCPIQAPSQDKAMNWGEASGNVFLTERILEIAVKKREEHN